MSTTYRCIICHKDLKSSSEKKRRKCNSCIHKKSTASTAIASVALVAAGAAIGFIGGYVASLWSDKNNTPKIKEETKQNNEIDTTMYDPDQDIAACPICYDSRVNIALSPCGHTLCKDCTDELPNKICPMCSKNIKSQQTIYIN
eukprot:746818_1